MRADLQKALNSAATRKGNYPLPEVIEEALSQNEQVLHALYCNVPSKTHKDRWGLGIVILTNRQIYIFKRALVWKLGDAVEIIPIDRFNGIDRKRQMLGGWTVILSRAGNSDELWACDAGDSEKLVSLFRDLIQNFNLAPTSGNVIQTDPIEQLRKLKELFDLGVLTEVEFESKKKTLMDKI